MSNYPWRSRYPLLRERYLAGEQSLMRKTYPQFKLVWTTDRLAFRGRLRSNYGGTFVVEIKLPDRYPEQEPHLWVLSPTLPEHTAHRYIDGRICGHAAPFVAYRTTVATMVSVMAGWLFRFDRERLEGVPWDEPVAPSGERYSVNPDGTLYV